MKSTILFLSANPSNTGRIRFDEEHRLIADKLTKAAHRDQFSLATALAARVGDFQALLLERRDAPLAVVHWSGHGQFVSNDPIVADATPDEGLRGRLGAPPDPESAPTIAHGEMVTEGADGNAHAVPTAALADLFGLAAGSIRCVVLNACFSESQARRIAEHIDFVVGTRRAIPDKDAIAFSEAFYFALGNGESLDAAFGFGKNAIALRAGGGDPEILQRYCRKGVDPGAIRLVDLPAPRPPNRALRPQPRLRRPRRRPRAPPRAAPSGPRRAPEAGDARGPRRARRARASWCRRAGRTGPCTRPPRPPWRAPDRPGATARRPRGPSRPGRRAARPRAAACSRRRGALARMHNGSPSTPRGC